MDFPGSETVKKRIMNEAKRSTLPHAAIVTGGGQEEREAVARLLSAALVCEADRPPCMECVPCRKVMREIHPDVMMLRTEGKTFSVGMARDIKNSVGIRPGEAERKIYVLCDGDCLNDSSANALLKTIEEPPPYAAFILLCENPQLLPETVRSRCALYRLSPGKATSDSVAEALAEKLAVALLKRDELLLASFAASLEKTQRDGFRAFLAASLELLAGAAVLSAGAEDRSFSAAQRKLAETFDVNTLLSLTGTVKKLERYSARNTGIGHMAGLLAVECWEDIS